MESRLIIAYSLMLIMALLFAGLVAYRIYHSDDRSYRRRLRKQKRLDEAPSSTALDRLKFTVLCQLQART